LQVGREEAFFVDFDMFCMRIRRLEVSCKGDEGGEVGGRFLGGGLGGGWCLVAL